MLCDFTCVNSLFATLKSHRFGHLSIAALLDYTRHALPLAGPEPVRQCSAFVVAYSQRIGLQSLATQVSGYRLKRLRLTGALLGV